MNTISNTAYYCCGIRMEDARKKHSVCNDKYAEKFMDERGLQIFEPFKSEKWPNISCITRCKLIDDHLLRELAKNKQTSIITIGAGFDTRPYRLAGGNWLEIDEPQIINYKNEKLPIESCPNTLKRISIDFSRESLTEKLAEASSSDHTIIVIEGVFIYLDDEAIETTLKAIQALFPKHTLYCDLMTKKFFTQFSQSIHEKLIESGGKFTERPDFPEEIFTRHHYKKIEHLATIRGARKLGILWQQVKVPKFMSWLMLNVFYKNLEGYAVYRFNFEKR